jgi:hypothetical protein
VAIRKAAIPSDRFGVEPGHATSLRVNPRPVLANVYQRPAGYKLKIKLAGIRQRSRKVERAMGIEYIGDTISAYSNQQVVIQEQRCV